MNVSEDLMRSRVQRFFGGHEQSGPSLAPEVEAAVQRHLTLVADGEFGQAYLSLRDESALDAEAKKQLVSAVNLTYLFDRELEWTNHGILRSFRFWGSAQKVAYVRLAGEIMAVLGATSPFVSLGFGSVLSFMRDGDFIPHDDDLDIIVAFPADGRAPKFRDALERVERELTAAGFSIHGDLPSHRNVNRDGGTAVDVFVGFVENERASWFPSSRQGIPLSTVFPTQTVEFLGVPVAIPGDPEAYLRSTYGEDWRTPIASWNHPWNLEEYRDLI